LLLLFITLTLTQFFIPTKYDSAPPQSYQAKKEIYYQAVLCSTAQYIGCVANVTVNLPHDAWSWVDGRYLQFSVMSDLDGCTKELCRNNASSPTMSSATSCTFPFSSDLANLHNVYIRTVSGASPDIQATVNLIFNCPPPNQMKSHESIQSENYEKRVLSTKTSVCPLTVTPLKEIIQLSYVSQVITSPSYVDASKFFFFLCGDGINRYRATALTIGTTIDSAFATYICEETPCTPSNSPFYDPSGTGINTVDFQTSTTNPVEFFVTIYGWGKFKQWNFYQFGVQIEII